MSAAVDSDGASSKSACSGTSRSTVGLDRLETFLEDAIAIEREDMSMLNADEVVYNTAYEAHYQLYHHINQAMLFAAMTVLRWIDRQGLGTKYMRYRWQNGLQMEQ